MNLSGGRRGEAWVSAAGPLSNLVMAAIVALQPKPEVPAGITFVILAAFLGLGTGGVFAWVAAAAPKDRVGSVAGIVGAAGGLGGFFPPLVMGATYDEQDHSYTIGLLLLCATAVVALVYTIFGVRKRSPATAHG